MKDEHQRGQIDIDSVAPMVVSIRRLPRSLRNLLDVARREACPDQLPLLVLREAGRPTALVVAYATDFETWRRYGRQRHAASESESHAPIDNPRRQMEPMVAGDMPEQADYTLVEQVWLALAASLEMEESNMARSRATTHAEPEWFADLAALASAAGVPLEMAQGAESARLVQREGLGYRRKLLPWLKKLAVLIEAGYSWPEIHEWVKRRWQTGNEVERQWPRGFDPRT